MKSTLFYLHTLSALHVGVGQGIGVIDLPMAREQASRLPLVPGSSIKGVLRYELEEKLKKEDKQAYFSLFGPDTNNQEDASLHAGALIVGDARLLAFPVRSWRGTFAWATCPMILHRYQRDLSSIGTASVPSDIPIPPNEQTALLIEDDNTKTLISSLSVNNKIYLEDLDLDVKKELNVNQWADFIAKHVFEIKSEWTDLFKKRFTVLPDNTLDFLAETATEIRARIAIEENSRTVKDGALWYEEYLPAETLLWGVVASDRPRRNKVNLDENALLKKIPTRERLQIGGNATTGGGQTYWVKQGE